MALKTFKNKEEALQYLNTLSIASLIDLAADLLVERALPKKISITEEQFRTMFRITGMKEDGTIETRGRKKTKEPGEEPDMGGIFED